MGLRSLTMCIATSVLVGCAASDTQAPVDEPESGAERPLACGPELSGRARMHFDLIEQMADKGRDRAALAHLDALESIQVTVPVEAKLLRAHAHRRLGETELARELYKEIEDTCMPGEGLHGLALLAAERGDVDEAIETFGEAIRHRPVDAGLRNDLGYAYLLQGKHEKAREHLETARELGAGEKAASNLIVLLIRQGRYEQARSLAHEAELDEQQWRALGREAEQMKDPDSRRHQ